jgi:S1-C subfamily serine protease
VRRTFPLALAAVALAVAGARVATAHTTHAAVTTGVVDVETDLAYQHGAASGTGMVLTPSGEVLTNNHVIRGATTIKILVPATKRTYSAHVIGYDVADDVAVMKLEHATGLDTVSVGNSSTVTRGDAVSAVGNAGGTRTLTTTTGTITALARTITVRDDFAGSAKLADLIETNASLRPGDSGGPLLDSASRVIGMDTAASPKFRFRPGGGGEGFAIPINRAFAIAKQIVAGRSSAQVHVGGTAFLGVELQAAVVAGIVPGSPVARAGIVTGDVLRRLDGHRIASPTALVRLLLTKHPGDRVTLAWADGAGHRHTAPVTLASGPPQ